MVLVRSEPLGEFVNTFPAETKYCCWNRNNLGQQVPKQISLKRKIFSEFFIAFLKSMLNLEYVEKKDQSHSLNILEIINCETGSYLNVQKSIFHATLRQMTC